MPRVPIVLTVAGTDPSGGAGVQADSKAFSALGAYGTSVVTALVAQSTQGVAEVHHVPAAFVGRQLDVLLDDVRVDAVKTGMLASSDVVLAVADAIRRHGLTRVVVDPVMVATSGDRLLAADAVAALREELLPLADLMTPNVPEAADLLGVEPARDLDEAAAQLERLAALCPRVLLKGGHLGGPESTDLLLADGVTTVLSTPRQRTTSTHGTGCTLSAAVTALVARGAPEPATAEDWLAAVRDAKDYLTGALAAAGELDVGHGNGPQHHFWRLWPVPA